MPLLRVPPHDCIIDIMPDIVPVYVPVIVIPSGPMSATPSIVIMHGDIMPWNPPDGTVMRNVSFAPFTVPCIDPFPIMLRIVSAMVMLPAMAVPVCVIPQVIWSWPVESTAFPAHWPAKLIWAVPVDVGEGAMGEFADVPAHPAADPAVTIAITRARGFIIVSPSHTSMPELTRTARVAETRPSQVLEKQVWPRW